MSSWLSPKATFSRLMKSTWLKSSLVERMSWWEAMMSLPSPASLCMRSPRDLAAFRSSPVNGSSNRRTWASWAMARAMNARCCWPPESCLIWRFWRSVRSKDSSAWSTARVSLLVNFFHIPSCGYLPISTSPRTVTGKFQSTSSRWGR